MPLLKNIYIEPDVADKANFSRAWLSSLSCFNNLIVFVLQLHINKFEIGIAP